MFDIWGVSVKEEVYFKEDKYKIWVFKNPCYSNFDLCKLGKLSNFPKSQIQIFELEIS